MRYVLRLHAQHSSRTPPIPHSTTLAPHTERKSFGQTSVFVSLTRVFHTAYDRLCIFRTASSWDTMCRIYTQPPLLCSCATTLRCAAGYCTVNSEYIGRSFFALRRGHELPEHFIDKNNRAQNLYLRMMHQFCSWVDHCYRVSSCALTPLHSTSSACCTHVRVVV